MSEKYIPTIGYVEQSTFDGIKQYLKDEVNENLNKLRDAINARKKIEAIKIHRDMTGIGLKESKDFVESFDQFKNPTQPEAKERYAVFRFNQYMDCYLEGQEMSLFDAKNKAHCVLEDYPSGDVLVTKVVCKTVTTKTLKDC